MLYPNFTNHIKTHALLKNGDTVVVSVSGGIDSMCLLTLMMRLSKLWDLRLIAAHVNHGLRGKDSDADEALVKKFAETNGILFECLRKRPAKDKNLQDSARIDRKKFLRAVAKKYGADSVATAHNMRDQAETVLLHILRGTGLKGLSGMKPSSELNGLRIVRPLLFAPRKDIARYVRQKRIKFREDRTNKTLKYTRNAVRLRLLPMLAKFNPRIEEHLASLAIQAHDDESALEAIAVHAYDEALLHEGEGEVALKNDDYVHLPKAVRLRLLRRAYARLKGDTADINRDQLERMDGIALSCSQSGAYFLRGLRFTKNHPSRSKKVRSSCIKILQ